MGPQSCRSISHLASRLALSTIAFIGLACHSAQDTEHERLATLSSRVEEEVETLEGFLVEAEALASPAGAEWRADPFLTSQQNALLASLAAQSATPLEVDVWKQRGIVRQVSLDIPLGGRSDLTLEERAIAFLRTLRPLWGLDGGDPIEIVPRPPPTVGIIPNPGPCVAFNALGVHSSGLPLEGQSLTVVIKQDQGNPRVTAITGMVGLGNKATPLGPDRISEVEAMAILQEELGIHVANPSFTGISQEVIFDATEYGDDVGEPVHARKFSFFEETGELSSYFIVDAKSRSVVVRWTAASKDPTYLTCAILSGGAANKLPRVTTDPTTGRPVITSFSTFGGLETYGQTLEERAFSVMERPGLIELYGTRNPRRHLRNPTIYDDDLGGHHIHFDQYYGGIPVAGAGLTFHIDSDGKAQSIIGTFVYDPGIDTEPTVTAQNALSPARAYVIDEVCKEHTGMDRLSCEADLMIHTLAQPPIPFLTIFTTEVFHYAGEMPLKTHDEEESNKVFLAWKVEFQGHEVFIDAITGVALYGNSTTSSSHPTYSSEITGASGNIYYENDQFTWQGLPPDTDEFHNSQWTHNKKQIIDDFQHQTLGFKGMQKYAPPHVEFRVGPFGWFKDKTLAASFKPLDSHHSKQALITLPEERRCDDILAHEYAHGFIYYQGGLRYGGWEVGAIHESFGDVVGQAIFPRSDWDFGFGCGVYIWPVYPAEAVRNLANPGKWPYEMPAHMAFMERPCSYYKALGLVSVRDDNDCAHFWAGIPNHAAVMMAEGVTGWPHPGFGREAVAGLLMRTAASRKLANATRFVHLKEAMYQQCKELRESGSQIHGRDWTPEDCVHVDRAYNMVGVESGTHYGYYSNKNSLLAGSKSNFTLRDDDETFNGCYLTDQKLVLTTAKSNAKKVSGWADGNTVSLANGEAGARIEYRASMGDPTKRQVTVHQWSEWNHRNVIDVMEDFSHADSEFCVAPDGYKRIIAYSADYVNEWASLLIGNSGDMYVNWNVRFPLDDQAIPPCRMAKFVSGVHYHDLVPQGIIKSIGHDGHGYTAHIRDNTDHQLLGAKLHWWHDGHSQIRARVAYTIFQRGNPSFNCIGAMNGYLQADP